MDVCPWMVYLSDHRRIIGKGRTSKTFCSKFQRRTSLEGKLEQFSKNELKPISNKKFDFAFRLLSSKIHKSEVDVIERYRIMSITVGSFEKPQNGDKLDMDFLLESF